MYIFLIVQIREDRKYEEETTLRPIRGDRAAGALTRILKSRYVSQNTIPQLHKFVLRPIVI